MSEIKHLRLTEALRHKLLNALLAHRFDADKLALDLMENEIGQALYEHKYTVEERDVMARFPYMFSGESYIYGQIHAYRVCMNLCKQDGTPRILPVPFIGSSGNTTIPADSELAAKFEKLRAGRAGLCEERERVQHTAKATLRSFSTTQALARNWPEIVPFLPVCTPAAAPVRARVPMVQVQVLNDLLHLPAAETETKVLEAEGV